MNIRTKQTLQSLVSKLAQSLKFYHMDLYMTFRLGVSHPPEDTKELRRLSQMKRRRYSVHCASSLCSAKPLYCQCYFCESKTESELSKGFSTLPLITADAMNIWSLISPVIFQRLRATLADRLQCGEMNHTTKFVFAENFFKFLFIAKITRNKVHMFACFSPNRVI